MQHTVVKSAHQSANCTRTVDCTNITVKCCAKHLAFVGAREGGGREREKGVTRIQFITSEAAGTQPPIAHNGASVQNLFVQHYFAQTNFAR